MALLHAFTIPWMSEGHYDYEILLICMIGFRFRHRVSGSGLSIIEPLSSQKSATRILCWSYWIRKSRDYVYGIWEYQVLRIESYFSMKSCVVIFNEVLYTNPPLSIIPQNYKCIPNLNNVWPFLLTFTGLQTLLITLDLLKINKHTVVYGHIRTTLETEFMFDNMVRASDVPNVKYILCKITVWSPTCLLKPLVRSSYTHSAK